ncbi:MAG: cation transporter [Gammaproteobacteria bacterium]|nr:cation transporter [Gammaproteobacteria bacterium]
MIRAALDWLGFGLHGHSAHGHGHDHDSGGHGHTHGVVDPSIATTERGIWAIKWSFIGLAITAIIQMIVVWLSGSVALLADTIHNVGDASTAIPLYIAFWFARRKPNGRFTYGYGRVEDLAGVVVVALILFSAVVAGWQAIDRLINPQDISWLGAVAVAGIVGFVGNEIVAVFRIRVGREIQSAALIADGYHARVDGLTSLAVVLGALGVWLGFPLADPIVGLIITALIFGIVWQSARAVFSRMLDGVEPEIIGELHHAAEHVEGVRGLANVRARWVGHRLHAEAELLVDPVLQAADVARLAEGVRAAAMSHLPAMAAFSLGLAVGNPSQAGRTHGDHDHGEHNHPHGAHGHEYFL